MTGGSCGVSLRIYGKRGMMGRGFRWSGNGSTFILGLVFISQLIGGIGMSSLGGRVPAVTFAVRVS